MLAKACTWQHKELRAASLLALQQEALAASNFTASLTELALAGRFSLERYRQAQCADGCEVVNECGSSALLRNRQSWRCSEPLPTPALQRYTGPLCGLCAEGFGRVRLVECARCMPEDSNTGAAAHNTTDIVYGLIKSDRLVGQMNAGRPSNISSQAITLVSSSQTR